MTSTPAFGEQEREDAGAAAEVEDRSRAELLDHREVGVEVRAIRVERVVDRGEAWLVEDRIGHQEPPPEAKYDPSEMRRFHPPALHAALDAERAKRGLTWRALAAETGVAESTIRRLATPGRCEVDGILQLTSWLGRRVEDFTVEAAD